MFCNLTMGTSASFKMHDQTQDMDLLFVTSHDTKTIVAVRLGEEQWEQLSRIVRDHQFAEEAELRDAEARQGYPVSGTLKEAS